MKIIATIFMGCMAVLAICTLALIVGSIAWEEGWTHVAVNRAIRGDCPGAWSASANAGRIYSVEDFCPVDKR